MDSYLHQEQADRPEALAAALGRPVLFADSPLHRRVAVHFLWLPYAPSPKVYRDLAIVLEELARAELPEFGVLRDLPNGTASYYNLRLTPPPENQPHG